MSEWADTYIGYDNERTELCARLSETLVTGCDHNGHQRFAREAKRVVFEWTNGSDEPSFAWIVEMQDGKFATVTGWHDYTGWDCQSGVTVDGMSDTLAEAVRLLEQDPRHAYEEENP